ncbi:MAG: hypothetical protein IJQ55_01505 [Alphaproteobacteria bacterium]|nr:hypothetical protein [Alphaproteobacteria bacterium]
MIYSKETTQTARNYNIDERTVIFCRLVAAGADLRDAYYITHGKKETTNESTTSKGRDLIKATPGAKILIQRYKNRKPINNTEGQRAAEEAREEDNNIINGVELDTRADVVAFLKKNLRRISGKDAISGAQTLARLEGYDRMEEKPEEEKRHFYLPFVSTCRSCPLARVFDSISKKDV